MRAKLASCLIIVAVMGLLPEKALGQLYSSCDQWANYTTNGYIIYNNIWGSGAGSQCLTVNSSSNWYVDANHPAGSGGIKSYPNVTRDVNLNVDNMGSVTSTFSVTRPSGGSYSTTYDIWYNNFAYEIMLWMNYTGAVGPIAESYNCNGACPSATNVNVGGHTWNVYRGSNGSNQVFSFLRTSNTNSGTVDITAISQWLRNNGWFGNVNLHKIQLGFEITASSGNQRYSVTNFSVTTGSGGNSLTVSPTSLSVASTSGSSTVSVTSNVSWTVSDNQSWLSVSPTSGSNNGSFSVTRTANSSSSSRTGTVTVTGGGITRTINVTQSGTGGGGTTYYKFQNRATGLYIDGMGSTSNGSNCGQYGNGSSYNQQWVMETSGSYVKLRNRGTGLYLDGMGRTSNGSAAGQWSSSTSNNQQWTRVISGSYSRFQNRATGLYLDGMGRTSNGSDLGQWSSSSSNNQQWTVSTVLGKESEQEESEAAVPELPAHFNLHQNYPNPFNPDTRIGYQMEEAGFVTLEIFDLLGRKVRTLVNDQVSAGFHEVRWNSANDAGIHVPSGMYLYTMKVAAGSRVFSETRRMYLVK